MAIRRGHSGRVDVNQAEIVEALRKAGYSVQSLASVGDGCPDILVGGKPWGRYTLMEIKQPKAKLTPDERRWHESWQGTVYIVRSAEEALEVIR